MKLRVGLVGLGTFWETRHRPALRALNDRFEVRAICEPVAARAEVAAREFGAMPVDGYQSLARRDDIDAVLMLSNQWYGTLPVLAACDHGKAIYCATGLDLDPVQAERIKERVEGAGVAFMTETPCRQAPATLRLKELIATRLGEPRLLFCHRRRPTDDQRPALASCGRSESPWHDLVELVDWCRYVVGREPTSVFGYMHAADEAARDEDYQWMNVDFSPNHHAGGGPAAQISCGRYMPSEWHEAVTFRPPAALQVSCEHGIAFVDLPATLIWFDKAGRHLESLESERPVGEQLLASFHRAVTSLVRNTASLQDAYRALRVVTQARASHLEGRRMPLAFDCA